RRLYDSGVAQGFSLAVPAIAFEGCDFTTLAEGQGAGTFSERLAEMFRPPVAADAPREGPAVYTVQPLTYAQAMQGGEFPVTVTRQERCRDYEGAGMRRSAESTCGRCQGAGAVRWARGHMVFKKDCAVCGATGRLRQQPCASC